MSRFSTQSQARGLQTRRGVASGLGSRHPEVDRAQGHPKVGRVSRRVTESKLDDQLSLSIDEARLLVEDDLQRFKVFPCTARNLDYTHVLELLPYHPEATFSDDAAGAGAGQGVKRQDGRRTERAGRCVCGYRLPCRRHSGKWNPSDIDGRDQPENKKRATIALSSSNDAGNDEARPDGKDRQCKKSTRHLILTDAMVDWALFVILTRPERFDFVDFGWSCTGVLISNDAKLQWQETFEWVVTENGKHRSWCALGLPHYFYNLRDLTVPETDLIMTLTDGYQSLSERLQPGHFAVLDGTKPFDYIGELRALAKLGAAYYATDAVLLQRVHKVVRGSRKLQEHYERVGAPSIMRVPTLSVGGLGSISESNSAALLQGPQGLTHYLDPFVQMKLTQLQMTIDRGILVTQMSCAEDFAPLMYELASGPVWSNDVLQDRSSEKNVAQFKEAQEIQKDRSPREWKEHAEWRAFPRELPSLTWRYDSMEHAMQQDAAAGQIVLHVAGADDNALNLTTEQFERRWHLLRAERLRHLDDLVMTEAEWAAICNGDTIINGDDCFGRDPASHITTLVRLLRGYTVPRQENLSAVLAAFRDKIIKARRFSELRPFIRENEVFPPANLDALVRAATCMTSLAIQDKWKLDSVYDDVGESVEAAFFTDFMRTYTAYKTGRELLDEAGVILPAALDKAHALVSWKAIDEAPTLFGFFVFDWMVDSSNEKRHQSGSGLDQKHVSSNLGVVQEIKGDGKRQASSARSKRVTFSVVDLLAEKADEDGLVETARQAMRASFAKEGSVSQQLRRHRSSSVHSSPGLSLSLPSRSDIKDKESQAKTATPTGARRYRGENTHDLLTGERITDFAQYVAYGSLTKFWLIGFDHIDASLAIETDTETGLQVLVNPVRGLPEGAFEQLDREVLQYAGAKAFAGTRHQRRIEVPMFNGGKWTLTELVMLNSCLKGWQNRKRRELVDHATLLLLFKPRYVQALKPAEKVQCKFVMMRLHDLGWKFRRHQPGQGLPVEAKATRSRKDPDKVCIDILAEIAQYLDKEHVKSYLRAFPVSPKNLEATNLYDMTLKLMRSEYCIRMASRELLVVTKTGLERDFGMTIPIDVDKLAEIADEVETEVEDRRPVQRAPHINRTEHLISGLAWSPELMQTVSQAETTGAAFVAVCNYMALEIASLPRSSVPPPIIRRRIEDLQRMLRHVDDLSSLRQGWELLVRHAPRSFRVPPPRTNVEVTRDLLRILTDLSVYMHDVARLAISGGVRPAGSVALEHSSVDEADRLLEHSSLDEADRLSLDNLSSEDDLLDDDDIMRQQSEFEEAMDQAMIPSPGQQSR